MFVIKKLVKFLEMRKIFNSPLANHFLPVMQGSRFRIFGNACSHGDNLIVLTGKIQQKRGGLGKTGVLEQHEKIL
jgi:hypothetical protein